jgi:hypothetical protein
MALVSNGWWVTVTVADNGNNRGSYDFECDPAVVTDSATADTAALSLIAALNNVSNGIVVAYSIAERFRENAITLPPSGVELNTKASMSLIKASDGLLGNFRLSMPTPVAGVVFTNDEGGGANVVQTNSATLATFLDHFRAGGAFLWNDGDKMGQLIKGKRIGAKSNNG